MKTSINLVSKKRKPSAFRKRFFVVSIGFFSAIFVISVSLILYRLILQNQLAELESDEAKLISVVNQNPEKKVKYLTVRERLIEINNIMKRRKNINARISSVQSSLAEEVSITLIEGDETSVKLRVASENLLFVNNLLEQKINEYAAANNKIIKRIEMTSFNLNPTSLQYEVNFIIEFI